MKASTFGMSILVMTAIVIVAWMGYYASLPDASGTLFPLYFKLTQMASLFACFLSSVSLIRVHALLNKSDRESGRPESNIDDRIERQRFNCSVFIKIWVFASYWGVWAALGTFFGCIVCSVVYRR